MAMEFREFAKIQVTKALMPEHTESGATEAANV
jgi:hypothetical protein